MRRSLLCHENGAFRKRCSNRRNLKTPAVRFSVVFVGEDRCVTTLKTAARETGFRQSYSSGHLPYYCSFDYLARAYRYITLRVNC